MRVGCQQVSRRTRSCMGRYTRTLTHYAVVLSWDLTAGCEGVHDAMAGRVSPRSTLRRSPACCAGSQSQATLSWPAIPAYVDEARSAGLLPEPKYVHDVKTNWRADACLCAYGKRSVAQSAALHGSPNPLLTCSPRCEDLLYLAARHSSHTPSIHTVAFSAGQSPLFQACATMTLTLPWSPPPWLLPHLLLAGIAFNFFLVTHFRNHPRIRAVYLFCSSFLLLLVPTAVQVAARSIAVQIAGAFFAVYARAIDYNFNLPDPSHGDWSLFVSALKDTFMPFEQGVAISAAGTKSSNVTDGGKEQLRQDAADSAEKQQRTQLLARQPLVPAHLSYPAALLRLGAELVVQYLVYDSLLTLVIKVLSATTVTDPGTPRPTAPVPLPPLLSPPSIVASVAFSTVLYLHFALSYKSIVAALSLVLLRPRLLYDTCNVFREPWRGIMSPTELWQRWHQMFRMTFVRIGYRPARAAVRRLAALYSTPPSSTTSTVSPHPSDANSSTSPSTATIHATNGAAAPAPPPPRDSKSISPPRGLAGRPGASWLSTRVCEEVAGVMAVFAWSGVTHEFMLWAVFGSWACGWQLAFFLLHGAACLAESSVRRTAAVRRSTALRWAVNGACAVFVVLTSTLFMRPWLAGSYHLDFWHPVSPAGWLLGQVERVAAAGGRWGVMGSGAGTGTGIGAGGEL